MQLCKKKKKSRFVCSITITKEFITLLPKKVQLNFFKLGVQ